jgi:TolA-binding protein
MTIPMMLGAAVALMQTVATAAPVQSARQARPTAAARAVTTPAPASTSWGAPPDPWATQDPADSLYRAARRALNRNDYSGAAARFRAISRRFPRSAYAGDALYWEAFALYRAGGIDNLRAARAALGQQAQRYATAGTRESGDAATLAARIDGELARRGDAEASARTTAQATAAASAPTRTQTGACPDADDEDDPRVAALNALLQMDAENALPILKRVLARRDACSVGLRRKAVFLVSQKKGADTEAILLDVVRNDPDGEVREQAVFWLSQVPSERTAVLLDSLLRSSTDRQIQEKALFALSQHRSERGGDALRAYVQRTDAPMELREQAIFWLGQRRSEETATFLRDMYARLTERQLREKIVFSLSQQRSAENARWLLERARDASEDLELRKQALFWAGQGGAPIADLVGIYDQMPDREMREQLIFVYSQRRDPAAVDKMFDIARRDPDRELRTRAIFWLGQSKDPRVMQFLSDLINEP